MVDSTGGYSLDRYKVEAVDLVDSGDIDNYIAYFYFDSAASFGFR